MSSARESPEPFQYPMGTSAVFAQSPRDRASGGPTHRNLHPPAASCLDFCSSPASRKKTATSPCPGQRARPRAEPQSPAGCFPAPAPFRPMQAGCRKRSGCRFNLTSATDRSLLTSTFAPGCRRRVVSRCRTPPSRPAKRWLSHCGHIRSSGPLAQPGRILQHLVRLAAGQSDSANQAWVNDEYRIHWEKNIVWARRRSGRRRPDQRCFQSAESEDLSSADQPFFFNEAINYRRRQWAERSGPECVRDWTLSAILTYAAAHPSPVPGSQNNLSTVLFRSTFANRVPGQPLWLKNPNCGCIDPNKDFAVEFGGLDRSRAWGVGHVGAYYGDYRAPVVQRNRRVSAAYSVYGRRHVEVRAEFQTCSIAFSWLVLHPPTLWRRSQNAGRGADVRFWLHQRKFSRRAENGTTAGALQW